MADQLPTLSPVPGSYPAPPKAGMALAALVCAILGFCIPGLGLVGLILGIIAVVRAGNDPAHYRGTGLAIAGLVVGAVSLAMGVAVTLPALARARELSKRVVCEHNMKGVAVVLLVYASNNNGALPDDVTEALKASGLSPKALQCPSGQQSNYRYIPGWSRKDRADEPILYEPLTNHGDEGGIIVYLDGHAEFVDKDRWIRLIGSYEGRSIPVSPP
jgi:Domain of unknown function (DUF4190)